MAAAKPYYVLFAGVNGAGKSTLFRSNMWQHGSVGTSLPRVNSDEILVEHGWNPNEQSAQVRAGRIALARIRELFGGRHSFNQETTLTGKGILRNIHQAHATGYRIVVYFIGLENPEIANERIVIIARLLYHPFRGFRISLFAVSESCVSRLRSGCTSAAA